MKIDDFHKLLGLARRAGKLVLGSGGVESTVRARKAMLVIMAKDSAESTIKRLTDKCRSYNVPLIILGTKQSLGNITGKDEAAAIAVTDSNFAGVLKRISEENNGGVCND